MHVFYIIIYIFGLCIYPIIYGYFKPKPTEPTIETDMHGGFYVSDPNNEDFGPVMMQAILWPLCMFIIAILVLLLLFGKTVAFGRQIK
jgi:hypothetical protein